MIVASYIDHMGSDLSVVNAARVSFGKKREVFDAESDTGLIKYLAKHKHLSPFGHAFASFHIAAPVFVARQLVKHKFLRWNEESRRYISSDPTFYTPPVWRTASDDKKQGSGGTAKSQYFPTSYCNYGNQESLQRYKKMLQQGIAPEQARMILPATMMTQWYWSGSLDAFSDMCRLRCATDTQYESRLVADQISSKMRELFPVSWGALQDEETHNSTDSPSKG